MSPSLHSDIRSGYNVRLILNISKPIFLVPRRCHRWFNMCGSVFTNSVHTVLMHILSNPTHLV